MVTRAANEASRQHREKWGAGGGGASTTTRDLTRFKSIPYRYTVHVGQLPPAPLIMIIVPRSLSTSPPRPSTFRTALSICISALASRNPSIFRLLLDQAQLGLEGFPLLLLDGELVSRL